MAQRSHAHDSYGRVLPELAEANQAVLLAHPENVEQLQHIRALLEEQYRVLLRRGVSARLSLLVDVTDGMIQPTIHLGVQRHYRRRRPK